MRPTQHTGGMTMAQLYRFYLHVEGGDSRTAALVWADSDSEALELGFEVIGPAKTGQLLAAEGGESDEVFFSTENVLERAKDETARDLELLESTLRTLLHDYIEEMKPHLSGSTIANQAYIYADDVMRFAK
jgi:hypothetical protein